MALKFFDFLRPKTGRTYSKEVSCKELCEAATELKVRELCLAICINLIANAIGKCEYRTYRDGDEVFEREYYMWNYEPNINQCSTEFLHKLVSKMLLDGEALVISTKNRNGSEGLVVADAFIKGSEYPAKQNEYTNVTVGDMTYSKTFRENDVMYFRPSFINAKPVLDAMNGAYDRLIEAADKNYKWSKGQHWKVHVNQVAQGEENWLETFQKMINDQVKPFFNADAAVLPEFDGYEYTREGEAGTTRQDSTTRDIKALIDDVFAFTARAFHIPPSLSGGEKSDEKEARDRFMTDCIDPLCELIQEEATRKRYGYELWQRGSYIRVDSTTIQHFDLFEQAANVEKLIGSGVYTINDLRRAVDQSAVNEKWADEHFMTLNIARLTDEATTIEGAGENE